MLTVEKRVVVAVEVDAKLAQYVWRNPELL
jgi:hypothetical protein